MAAQLELPAAPTSGKDMIYFTPVLGGLIGDRILGRRNAVILGCVLMTLETRVKTEGSNINGALSRCSDSSENSLHLRTKEAIESKAIVARL